MDVNFMYSNPSQFLTQFDEWYRYEYSYLPLQQPQISNNASILTADILLPDCKRNYNYNNNNHNNNHNHNNNNNNNNNNDEDDDDDDDDDADDDDDDDYDDNNDDDNNNSINRHILNMCVCDNRCHHGYDQMYSEWSLFASDD